MNGHQTGKVGILFPYSTPESRWTTGRYWLFTDKYCKVRRINVILTMLFLQLAIFTAENFYTLNTLETLWYYLVYKREDNPVK